MKKVLIGLGVLLLLLIAGALVAPGFIDWNSYRERLAAEVEAATGRDMTIEGDLSLRLVPRPAFSAEKVRLANLEGGSTPNMVTLEHLEVRVAPLPLLQGRLKVEKVALVEPVIVLEILEDGRRNWEFEQAAGRAASTSRDQAPAQEEGSSEDGPGVLESIQLDSFAIVEGTVIYRDAVRGREERLEPVNAEITADTLNGPFSFDGRVGVRGLEPEILVSVGQLRENAAAALNVDIRLPEADSSLSFGGALSTHFDGNSLRGSLKVSGDSGRELVRALAPEAPAPEFLAAGFSAEADLMAEPGEIRASELRLTLGALDFDGEVRVLPRETLTVDASLSAARLNVDDLIAQLKGAAEEASAGSEGAEEKEQPAAQDDAAEPEEVAGTAFELPEDVTARLEVDVDTMIYKGQVARQGRIQAVLEEGELTLERVSALLPGGSDVALNGRLTDAEDGPSFSGSVEGASDNFRSLLGWLGVDVSAVPADRLRRVSINSDVAYADRRLNLENVDLRVDVTRVSGGIAMILRERPGLGIALSADNVNVDAYLPAAPRQEGSGEEAAQAGDGGEQDPGVGAGNPLSGLPAPPSAFDANVKLRVANLAYRGKRMSDLLLDGRLRDGEMTLREFKLGDQAGNTVAFTGELSGLPTDTSVDGVVELKLKDPPRLAETIGASGEGLEGLGPVGLSSQLRGTPEELAFDGVADLLGGTIDLSGTLSAFARPVAFSADLGLKHGSLEELGRKMGASLEPGLGGLDIVATAEGTSERVSVRGIEGNIGPSSVKGTMEVVLASARPRIVADLATGDLPLSALGVAGESSAGSSRKAKPKAESETKPVAGGSRWSTAPMELDGMQQIDGELHLRSSAWLLDEVRLREPELEARLADGVLTIARLNAGFYEGTLAATGTVDGTKSIDAAIGLELKRLSAGDLMTDLADSDRISGPVNLNVRLRARGDSEHALVNSLAGEGELTGTLQVKSRAEEQAGAAVLEILGQKIEEIRNLSDATTTLFRAFAGSPSDLSGTFTIDKGVAVTKDTRLRGQDATARTKATINLPNWRLDSMTEVYRSADSEEPYVTAALRGPLDEPNVRLGGAALATTDKAPDGKEKPLTVDDVVEDPKKLLENKDEILKDPGGFLENLLNKQE